MQQHPGGWKLNEERTAEVTGRERNPRAGEGSAYPETKRRLTNKLALLK